jgi:hypothetical protein
MCTFTDENEWPKLWIFLEVTLIKLINIFILKLEIDPAVWGFNFVSIVKYISLSPPMLGDYTFVSYGISVWFCC